MNILGSKLKLTITKLNDILNWCSNAISVNFHYWVYLTDAILLIHQRLAACCTSQPLLLAIFFWRKSFLPFPVQKAVTTEPVSVGEEFRGWNAEKCPRIFSTNHIYTVLLPPFVFSWQCVQHMSAKYRVFPKWLNPTAPTLRTCKWWLNVL
jgi:hypothetical protein